MSRWWHDRWSVQLTPEGARAIAKPRGLRARAGQSTYVHASASADPSAWRPAVVALERALAACERRGKAELHIELSDHFVRYCVVPWSDQLRSESEVALFGRHRMREIYGAVAADWTVRLSAGWPGRPRIAAAVEQALVAELDALADRLQARILRLAPRFTALADRHRRELKGAAFWFAASDSGRIVAARCDHGDWAAILSARDGEAPGKTLLGLLARESFETARRGASRVYMEGFGMADEAALIHAGWDARAVRVHANPRPTAPIP